MTKPTHNVTTPIQRSGMAKPFWHRIGSAWVDGDKIRLSLDSLPLPQMYVDDNGTAHPDRGLQTNLVRFKDDGPRNSQPVKSAEFDDEVPF